MRTDTRTRLRSMLEEYRAIRARLNGLAVEVGALTATARSADRSVSATVGARGELTHLVIDARLAETLDTRALAARVVEAVRLASSLVRELVHAKVSDVLPEGLRHHVRSDGSVDAEALVADADRAWPCGGR